MPPNTAALPFTSSKTRCSTAKPSVSTAPSAWRQGRYSSSPRTRGPILRGSSVLEGLCDHAPTRLHGVWVPARASLGRDDGGEERCVTKPLLIEHDDGVDRVTLNRPESLNAL